MRRRKDQLAAHLRAGHATTSGRWLRSLNAAAKWRLEELQNDHADTHDKAGTPVEPEYRP